MLRYSKVVQRYWVRLDCTGTALRFGSVAAPARASRRLQIFAWL